MLFPRSFRSVLGGLLVLAGLLWAGCDVLGNAAPTEAELRLDGLAGARAELLISTNFLSQQQPVFDDQGILLGDTLIVELLQSQTVTVTLPFAQTYDISQNHQFYVRIRRFNPENDQLHARLWIDGGLRGDRRPGATLDSLTLVYNFLTRNVDPDSDEV